LGALGLDCSYAFVAKLPTVSPKKGCIGFLKRSGCRRGFILLIRAGRKEREMGFLDKFFGGTKYPELDPGSEAARQLDKFGEPVKKVAKDIKDRLEVVTSDNGAFIFIGKPPKQFGVMWVDGSEVMNLKALAKAKSLDASTLNAMVEKMRRAYERHNSEERFVAHMADREIVIHPSDEFEHEMEAIVDNVAH
jgi:hypothetical protein